MTAATVGLAAPGEHDTAIDEASAVGTSDLHECIYCPIWNTIATDSTRPRLAHNNKLGVDLDREHAFAPLPAMMPEDLERLRRSVVMVVLDRWPDEGGGLALVEQAIRCRRDRDHYRPAVLDQREP
jgi:hypothetical protein